MIVWLNGTFGVGKTATAAALCKKWVGSRVFDPEEVGYSIVRNLPDYPISDFQDLEPWRRLTVCTIDEVSRFTGQHLIAVQSVMRFEYWSELKAGLRERGHEVFHVLLETDNEHLRERIDSDEREKAAREWRLKQMERFVEERSWMTAEADLVVVNTSLSPEEVSDLIIGAIWDR